MRGPNYLVGVFQNGTASGLDAPSLFTNTDMCVLKVQEWFPIPSLAGRGVILPGGNAVSCPCTC